MKPSELLKTTGWTQGAYARDFSGYSTNKCGEFAASFCVRGAILRCYPGLDSVDITDKLERHVQLISGMDNLIRWNDDPRRTKEEVIAALEAVGE